MSDLVERLNVTQADRDAAASLLSGSGGWLWHQITDGERDHQLAVQAFASHRIAASSEAATRIETLELERDAARNAALEEAAKVCEAAAANATEQIALYDSYGGPELAGRRDEVQRASTARICATAIRALGGTL